MLTAIGIQYNEDLAAKDDRNWTPIDYAQEKLQFTQHITIPAKIKAPNDITIRPLMTFKQENRDQSTHQFLGVISNPTIYCFKIRTKIENKHYPIPRFQSR